MQATNNLIMVRPAAFGFNEETAESNTFQQQQNQEQQQIQHLALAEFDQLAETLAANGLQVQIVADTLHPIKPDAIFPNNWVSLHENGQVFLYPMHAGNRRGERRIDLINSLKEQYQIKEIVDLSYFEKSDQFLEGTGSMVLDRINKIVYACISPRTNREVLAEFCRLSGYSAVSFYAYNGGVQIYHTNVMMCMGEHFVVICLDAIPDEMQKQQLTRSFEEHGQEIIPISLAQMNAFAGNMLEVEGKLGEKLLVMSSSAKNSLSPAQIDLLEKYCRIVSSPIPTIETIGGGSVRCMLAEVHLKKAI